MNKIITILILACAVGLLAACSGEEREPTLLDVIAREKAEIRDFLAGQGNITVTPIVYLSKKGQVIDTTYLFNHAPAPASPAPGDFVLYDYSLRRLDGHYIESTDHSITVDTFRYVVRGPLYHRVDTSKHYDYVGNALERIAEGTTGELLVPSILLDKSGMTRHYTLAVHRVIRDLFAHEKALVQDYINTTGATTTYQDGNGDTLVHTIIRVDGTGDRLVQPGDSLTIYRTCFVLRENTPLHEAFPLDTLVMTSYSPTSLELPACGPALARLREGDEAEIIIPYLLAFNNNPGYHPADTKKVLPWIPPYSTLVYAVKVARVREKI